MRPESKGVLTDIQAGWTVTYCPLPIYTFLMVIDRFAEVGSA